MDQSTKVKRISLSPLALPGLFQKNNEAPSPLLEEDIHPSPTSKGPWAVNVLLETGKNLQYNIYCNTTHVSLLSSIYLTTALITNHVEQVIDKALLS